MAKNSRYCVQFRRRREGKTNYKSRKAFVLSGKPRLVTRITLKNVIAQIITAKPHGDEVLVSAHSRELTKTYGWKASKKNIPAAYLTGLLCGLKAKSKGIKEAIFDIGLHSPSKGAKVFAVLKGVLDAGVNVPYGEEKVPDEKRIKGEHIVEYAKNLASNTDQYQIKFSQYLKQKIPPESIDKHFAEIKAEIVAAFKKGGKKSDT
jgi:large subunit ribosomal protein L18